MDVVSCAACGQVIDAEALKRGVCPNCGADPLALPAASPPGGAWLASRLLFAVAVFIFAAVLRAVPLFGFGAIVLVVVLVAFWWKRRRWKKVTLRSPIPADDPPRLPEVPGK